MAARCGERPSGLPRDKIYKLVLLGEKFGYYRLYVIISRNNYDHSLKCSNVIIKACVKPDR